MFEFRWQGFGYENFHMYFDAVSKKILRILFSKLCKTKLQFTADLNLNIQKYSVIVQYVNSHLKKLKFYLIFFLFIPFKKKIFFFKLSNKIVVV